MAKKPAPRRPTGTPAKTGTNTGNRTGTRTAAKPKPSTAATATGQRTAPPGRRKPGRSIIDQRRRPWAAIAAAVAGVTAAAVVITLAATSGGDKKSNTPAATAWTQPETAAARAIRGLVYRAEPNHTHRDGSLRYDTTPPVGGDHNGYWADCSGTAYPAPIASENAVHALEHGAVWITYRPGLPAAQLQRLRARVDGVDRMMLSPYPALPAAISLQAWNYQLTVTNAADPRISQFIDAVRYNQATTPEYGATCSQPGFKTNPSRYGQPRSGPGMP